MTFKAITCQGASDGNIDAQSSSPSTTWGLLFSPGGNTASRKLVMKAASFTSDQEEFKDALALEKGCVVTLSRSMKTMV